MRTINHILEKQFLQAEGQYLDAQGLKNIERYVQTYATRLETYQNLREHNSSLVLQTLKRLGDSYPKLIGTHGQRCKYDMESVLRYIALSILRDDETFFTEEIVSWLDTILTSYKRHGHCATAYQILLQSIEADMPSANVTLIRPYIETVVLTLQSHVK